jgi:hypothetical protein
MPARELTVDEIMAILPATPARLAELAEVDDPTVLHAAPVPGEWSANDVLAHLRACEEVLGDSMLRILSEEHPAWRATNPRSWQKKSGYHDWQFGPALEAFTAHRGRLLAVLQPLPAEAWERTATVAVPPSKRYERSVRYYGDWLAGHERAHLVKLPKLIAAARERATKT